MKLAMILLYDYCLRMGYKMVATVHDEVLIEVPEEIARDEVHTLESIMRDCIEVSVPMKVDAEIMYRWGEGMDVEDFYDLQAGQEITRNVKGYDETYDTNSHTWKAVAQ